MTALSANVSREYRPGEVVENVPLAKTKTVYQGSLLEIDSSGNVQAATKASSKVYYGVSEEKATGGAAHGDVKIRVRRKGTFYFAKTGTAVRGKKAYVADDNTITDVATGASSCGTIIDTDAKGVWVELD